ncbi:MAG: nuclear transport factor 2 family protein, partial [Lysobacterales bacterium]
TVFSRGRMLLKSSIFAPFLFSVVLSACSTFESYNPAAKHSPATVDVVAEVSAAEKRWLTALNAVDFETLERVLAPEFVLASGRPTKTLILERSGWFNNSRKGPDALRQTNGRLLRIRPAGRDVAVAEVELQWLGDLYFITDTWVRRNGEWQVVYRHTSPAGKSPPE